MFFLSVDLIVLMFVSVVFVWNDFVVCCLMYLCML